MQKVSYTHPYVDSYYNRRDNSLMLAFSNPFDEHSLCNNDEFSIKLHSDVGFRNYLEKIYDMIIEWTRDEEAKYQASLVAKEVNNYRTESPEKDINASLISSPRSKSSKKDKLNVSEEKKSVESESKYITDNFVGHNSLKAWKLERDRQLEEKASADLIERAKKVKSPVKVGGKDSKMAKDSTRPLSRSPTKSATGNKSASKSKLSSSRPGSPKVDFIFMSLLLKFFNLIW